MSGGHLYYIVDCTLWRARKQEGDKPWLEWRVFRPRGLEKDGNLGQDDEKWRVSLENLMRMSS